MLFVKLQFTMPKIFDALAGCSPVSKDRCKKANSGGGDPSGNLILSNGMRFSFAVPAIS